MSEARGVEAVERALLILESFGPEVQEMSLAALSRQTGLYKSTILRLAVSLERFGLLVRDDDGQFRLGPATWRLGANYRNAFNVADIVRPELETLSRNTRETASFYVRDGDSRVCLFRREPLRAIRHSIVEGATLPLNRGASGKVLLAFSDDFDGDDNATRQAGYAISLGERDPEVAAIAVPVFTDSGGLAGALAVSGLISRFESEYRPALLRHLLASQKRLNGTAPD